MALPALMQALLSQTGQQQNVQASAPVANPQLAALTPPASAMGSATASPSSNPFASILSGAPAEQGTMRNFLSRIMGDGSNPTDVGSATSTDSGGELASPGTPSAATSNPTPMADQKQPDLAPSDSAGLQTHDDSEAPTSQYAQPSALDPVAIDQLRQSLLTQAGQLDPNNPNGLAGRMSSPNSQVDQTNQMNDAQSIEDAVNPASGTSNTPQKPSLPQLSNAARKSNRLI